MGQAHSAIAVLSFAKASLRFQAQALMNLQIQGLAALKPHQAEGY